jgi:hypothetical protein
MVRATLAGPGMTPTVRITAVPSRCENDGTTEVLCPSSTLSTLRQDALC